MMPLWCRSLIVLVAALGLAGAGRAEEKGPSIRDEANLFKPDKVAEAQKAIDQIQEKYHLGLLVETVPSLPVERKWYLPWKSDLRRRLTKMAQDRARDENLTGIIVLICTQPKVEVSVWPSQEPFFTTLDAARLRKLVLHRLETGQADAALADIVSDVRTVLHDTRADQPSALAGREWFPAFAIVAGIGIWGLIALVRRRMGPRAAGAPDLRPAVLAGRFGSPAAFWVYDRVFLAHRAAVPPAVPPVADVPGSPPEAGEVPADEDAPVALGEGPRA